MNFQLPSCHIVLHTFFYCAILNINISRFCQPFIDVKVSVSYSVIWSFFCLYFLFWGDELSVKAINHSYYIIAGVISSFSLFLLFTRLTRCKVLSTIRNCLSDGFRFHRTVLLTLLFLLSELICSWNYSLVTIYT